MQRDWIKKNYSKKFAVLVYKELLSNDFSILLIIRLFFVLSNLISSYVFKI